MSTVFLSAADARIQARNQGTIHSEIRAIEANVLTSIDSGLLSVTISGNTTMTGSNVYYNAYNGVTSNVALTDQISCVENYFLDLGYSVDILTNTQTNNTITWTIGW